MAKKDKDQAQTTAPEQQAAVQQPETQAEGGSNDETKAAQGDKTPVEAQTPAAPSDAGGDAKPDPSPEAGTPAQTPSPEATEQQAAGDDVEAAEPDEAEAEEIAAIEGEAVDLLKKVGDASFHLQSKPGAQQDSWSVHRLETAIGNLKSALPEGIEVLKQTHPLEAAVLSKLLKIL